MVLRIIFVVLVATVTGCGGDTMPRPDAIENTSYWVDVAITTNGNFDIAINGERETFVRQIFGSQEQAKAGSFHVELSRDGVIEFEQTFIPSGCEDDEGSVHETFSLCILYCCPRFDAHHAPQCSKTRRASLPAARVVPVLRGLQSSDKCWLRSNGTLRNERWCAGLHPRRQDTD